MSSIAANLHVDQVYSAMWALNECLTIPSAQATVVNRSSGQWRLLSATDNQNSQELMREDGTLVAPENGLYAIYLQTILQSQSDQDFPGGGDVEHWCVVSHKNDISPRLGLQMGGRCTTLSNSGQQQFFLPALSSSLTLSLFKESTITLFAYQKTGKTLSVFGESDTFSGTTSAMSLPKVGSIIGFHLINRHSSPP